MKKRYSYLAEPTGLFLRSHRPGVYAIKELTHEEDAGGEEGWQAADLGQPLPQYQREVGVGGILHDSSNAALWCGPQDRRPTHRETMQNYLSWREASLI